MTGGVDRRRGVRLALRLGVLLLARGAQTSEVERALRGVLRGLGLSGAGVVVTNATVSVSHIAAGDAEATTAIQPVRDWRPDLR